ncbi:RNA-binding protein NOB1 isoform X2 [Ischnura elegans]|uniref:RNA-binding protein NOB1 isoform X1 n=1 Tax=Ischnura elegans TaxID=197161 RepID=UPI001ED86A57|nr:RNA-binding protein NOB1 isoform X1 [Ischnura elegans]XP_046403162.1 RNA-binding protein NOB1 isoform X2 [Ischnura elegans]
MFEKINHLIVDTSGFLKSPELQNLGVSIYTVQNVVDEVTSKSQIRKLVVLPYDLHIKEPSAESIKFITDFSKKTGDYHSLSATDIRVMALTYQMELELKGSSHLKSEPLKSRDINFTKQSAESPRDIFGFYLPPKRDSKRDEEGSSSSLLFSPPILHVINEHLGDHSYLVKYSPSAVDVALFRSLVSGVDVEKCEHSELPISLFEEFPHIKRWMYHIKEISADITESLPEGEELTNEDVINFVQNMVSEYYKMKESNLESGAEGDSCKIEEFETSLGDDGFCDDEDDDYSEDDDDDGGWITPGNIKDAMKRMGGETCEDVTVEVGCLTTDFAMQNVLKQVGLSVVSLEGRLIRELRTHVLRCHACFNITSNPAGASLVPGVRSNLQGASIVLGAGLKYQFCPKCGYQGTLKKVAVTVDENGKQVINVSCRKPITGRGKRFSVPRPKGGKHSSDPIICADQRVPQRHPSRLARMKTDALDPDYIAGFSPFVMRDVNSRAAVLGIHGSDLKHWLRRNPNENKHGRRRKK